MIFAWDDINRLHLAKHAVSAGEAQEIVSEVNPPFPREIGDGKLIVWGQTRVGRYLQVIYVLKEPVAVAYESLSVEDWFEVESGKVTEIVRVIHAMDLTDAMKKRYRQQRR